MQPRLLPGLAQMEWPRLRPLNPARTGNSTPRNPAPDQYSALPAPPPLLTQPRYPVDYGRVASPRAAGPAPRPATLARSDRFDPGLINPTCQQAECGELLQGQLLLTSGIFLRQVHSGVANRSVETFGEGAGTTVQVLVRLSAVVSCQTESCSAPP